MPQEGEDMGNTSSTKKYLLTGDSITRKAIPTIPQAVVSSRLFHHHTMCTPPSRCTPASPFVFGTEGPMHSGR